MTELIVSTGQTIPLKIKRLGINGEGIGYFKKLIVFVPRALPGEEITATITNATPRYAEASLKKIIKKSKDRITPPCLVYDECGGCQLQHLVYQKQLDFKRDLLKQALTKFKPDHYKDYDLRPTIGMDDPWHYRNKAQFQLRKEQDEVKAGLYKANSHDLVAIDDCLVQEERTQEVINFVVDLLTKYQVPIYDEQQNSGIVRTLMVRVGVATDELQLVFITNSKKLPKKQAMIEELTHTFPEVVSIMQNVQNKKTSIVMGDETIHLWGKETIEETINDVTFDLSARAFFQLNPLQTSRLYQEAIDALDLDETHTVVDAYCGVGTIGLNIAAKVKKVLGMDIVPQAIDDAKQNARRMHAKNTVYEVGTAEEWIPTWVNQGIKIDRLIVDPPRTGLDQTLLDTLTAYPPEQMVYVSCNVSTLARDLKTLAKKFTIEYLQSVDMFPQTARCEVVVKLTRK
ncbi:MULTISPECIES: 23S rRNA (uracil(1939)-C(5))-methyltransferase RlmD [Enterococcus]|uniref:23S rRNA (Uracil-5-)-methyltransferase RumA n=1 Tax=Enterococcus sulfureus ATCC 49903 TaxID=1140003 RepID=S0P0J1_9ENTE|nr:23S rRNA (uracil(1939)-C(5))-methyltransferase RlmD [Enterococcus sulfureus]EOT47010.1 23S rRNA (uracil-5-)-methyltransferase RumA [Enterococcus sulfureus ATCC 49903]EOT83695.1 23S rRNA (uracil-5-)-methyltransferase RumA [Enterococcus sulfureus ATCC 49903]